MNAPEKGKPYRKGGTQSRWPTFREFRDKVAGLPGEDGISGAEFRWAQKNSVKEMLSC